MIYLYSGTPGSGKSLHMASNIRARLWYGKPVIGNFPVNTTAVRKCRGEYVYCPNDALTPEFLMDYSRRYFAGHRFHEGAIQLYIDEAQLLFNAREWEKTGRSGWIAFFTQHRKFGYDVYLVAQFDRMLDRQVRSLIEYEVIHRKMSNFGWRGYLLSLFFGGRVHVAIKMWYPLHERLGAEFIRVRKRLYTLYDSYAAFHDEQSSTTEAASLADNQPSDLRG